jgi:hypothetical protein
MYFQLEDTPELSNFCNASSMGFFSEACRRPAGGNSFRLLICAARNCLAVVGTASLSDQRSAAVSAAGPKADSTRRTKPKRLVPHRCRSGCRGRFQLAPAHLRARNHPISQTALSTSSPRTRWVHARPSSVRTAQLLCHPQRHGSAAKDHKVARCRRSMPCNLRSGPKDAELSLRGARALQRHLILCSSLGR